MIESPDLTFSLYLLVGGMAVAVAGAVSVRWVGWYGGMIAFLGMSIMVLGAIDQTTILIDFKEELPELIKDMDCTELRTEYFETSSSTVKSFVKDKFIFKCTENLD